MLVGRQMGAATVGPADLILSVGELTALGGDECQITKCVDAVAPIADPLGTLRRPPVGGLSFVDAPGEIQGVAIDAVQAGPGQRSLPQIESCRTPSRL